MTILLQSAPTNEFGVAALLVAAGIALAVGAVVGILVFSFASGRGLKAARAEADRLIADAKAQAQLTADAKKSEAEKHAREIELAAEKAAGEKRAAVDREAKSTQAKLDESLARAAKREETLDKKLESIGQREAKIDSREQALKDREETLDRAERETEAVRTELRGALSKVSGLSREEARELYLAEVRVESEHDGSALRQKILDEAERDAKGKAREITLMAIQRYAAENVGESTVRSIKITSED
ncbi:MAG: ribonuclease, partial [Planctomycetota bacterium]